MFRQLDNNKAYIDDVCKGTSPKPKYIERQINQWCNIKSKTELFSYLSNLPPCLPHSRQNRKAHTGGKDPEAEWSGAASDWVSVICQPSHWLRGSQEVGRKTIDVVRVIVTFTKKLGNWRSCESTPAVEHHQRPGCEVHILHHVDQCF